MKRSSDKDMSGTHQTVTCLCVCPKCVSGTLFRHGHACAFATSACLGHSSDKDVLVHSRQVNVLKTLQTRICLCLRHKRVSRTLLRHGRDLNFATTAANVLVVPVVPDHVKPASLACSAGSDSVVALRFAIPGGRASRSELETTLAAVVVQLGEEC